MQIKLIHTEPKGKPRPQVVTRYKWGVDEKGGRIKKPFSVGVHPDWYGKWQESLQKVFGKLKVDPPWKLSVVAMMKVAPSWPKKKKAELLWQPCQKTPDLDNIVGAVMDALFKQARQHPTKGTWKMVIRDNLVTELGPCAKFWGEEDMLLIGIKQSGGSAQDFLTTMFPGTIIKLNERTK